MRLIETRNCRTGAKQHFINGRRASNHEFSETWLKAGATGQGTIEQTRYGDRHIWEPGSVTANVEKFGGTAGNDFAHSPENCPSKHWNRGDDICADCGEDLQ